MWSVTPSHPAKETHEGTSLRPGTPIKGCALVESLVRQRYLAWYAGPMASVSTYLLGTTPFRAKPYRKPEFLRVSGPVDGISRRVVVSFWGVSTTDDQKW